VKDVVVSDHRLLCWLGFHAWSLWKVVQRGEHPQWHDHYYQTRHCCKCGMVEERGLSRHIKPAKTEPKERSMSRWEDAVVVVVVLVVTVALLLAGAKWGVPWW